MENKRKITKIDILISIWRYLLTKVLRYKDCPENLLGAVGLGITSVEIETLFNEVGQILEEIYQESKDSRLSELKDSMCSLKKVFLGHNNLPSELPEFNKLKKSYTDFENVLLQIKNEQINELQANDKSLNGKATISFWRYLWDKILEHKKCQEPIFDNDKMTSKSKVDISISLWRYLETSVRKYKAHFELIESKRTYDVMCKTINNTEELYSGQRSHNLSVKKFAVDVDEFTYRVETHYGKCPIDIDFITSEIENIFDQVAQLLEEISPEPENYRLSNIPNILKSMYALKEAFIKLNKMPEKSPDLEILEEKYSEPLSALLHVNNRGI